VSVIVLPSFEGPEWAIDIVTSSELIFPLTGRIEVTATFYPGNPPFLALEINTELRVEAQHTREIGVLQPWRNTGRILR